MPVIPPLEVPVVVGLVPVIPPLPEVPVVVGLLPVIPPPEVPVVVGLVPVIPLPEVLVVVGFVPVIPLPEVLFVVGFVPVIPPLLGVAVPLGRTLDAPLRGATVLLRGDVCVVAGAGRAGLAAGVACRAGVEAGLAARADLACRAGAGAAFGLGLLFWFPANAGTRSTANRHVKSFFINPPRRLS